MTKQFKQVSREEFLRFVKEYPRNLSGDVCGISEPALIAYYDFKAAKGWDAIVAKYRDVPETQREYLISEHLL